MTKAINQEKQIEELGLEDITTDMNRQIESLKIGITALYENRIMDLQDQLKLWRLGFFIELAVLAALLIYKVA